MAKLVVKDSSIKNFVILAILLGILVFLILR
jgi:hypothetical protein